ncbi:nucleotide exchange factor GrpE [Rhodospirillum rubrum]|uniref:Protein GrpE n=1 Tax=Rhodospirillum rubrum (strain ATCC 11170 / ATH 1.1.1 / DSM 467 / LMG 4362 / NCIMB 8255 / S1) TaxID=269796 RepID=Q2RN58_RHORT|nr:nucleotide exchange factor GrpE [Rhodospirillum rubrum]ABC24437.1 GrpE protein [Rhodospirillum rubrum ATCC 11170]AEO50188.1 GrpE protein [Rhodospirillum rubrum F11]MBK5956157.1 nucleotide exchange factor GrpE [Rhodospirillum rubrum]QXG80359.1 nucleotide exchange factor GrpE [Rhodospirillum rubrum]HAP98827.1 nucleotide exchange factor GrpE [Rhodospirillum rubrum]
MPQHNDTPESRTPQDSSAPASPAAAADDTTAAVAEAAEAIARADLEERITALEDDNRRLKEEYLRALAEAQNAKRMADKRIEDNSRYAVSNFAKAVLGVADNLGRALLSVPEEARGGNEMVKNLAFGVELTAKELENALAQYQIRRVEALNEAFDPHFHQAVQEVENTAVPNATIVSVLQDGYVIHDRLLRPAMVVVSRGGPKREPKPAADSADGGVNTTV